MSLFAQIPHSNESNGFMSNFIKKAVGKNAGKFTAKANKAGESVQQYANSVLAPGSGASSTTKHEAQFAKTMQSVADKKSGRIEKLSAKKKC